MTVYLTVPFYNTTKKYLQNSALKNKMARPRGFEPLTARFVAEYSIQLSYGRAIPRFGECLIRERYHNDSAGGIQLLLPDQ